MLILYVIGLTRPGTELRSAICEARMEPIYIYISRPVYIFTTANGYLNVGQDVIRQEHLEEYMGVSHYIITNKLAINLTSKSPIITHGEPPRNCKAA